MLKRFFFSFLAIFLLFEEWLWDVLTTLGRKLSVWLHLERFEEWLRKTSPKMALVAFAIPLLIVTPLNLIALGMIAHGKILHGVLLEIVAKLIGTVLIARVFALTRAQLLTLRWFKVMYDTITGWLEWAHVRIRATWAYQRAKKLKQEVKATLGAWLGKLKP